MSAGRLSQHAPVQRVLDNCRRQILQQTLLVGVATVAIAIVAYGVSAGLLDYMIGLPAAVRIVVLVNFILVIAVVAWKSLIGPLMRSLPPEQLGAAVDLSAPELKESLATLISIERPDVTAAEAGSEIMRSRLKQQITDHLSGLNMTSVVDSGRTRRRCGLAGLLLLLALLPFLLWPSGSSLLAQRLISPLSNLATVSNLYFVVPDGNRTVAKGTTVQIAATPMWRTSQAGERPKQVDLRLIAASGDMDTLPMMFDEVGGRYVADLPRISESVQYQIYGGGARTEVFALTVVDAPEIRAAVMTTTPPLYAGRAIERFDGMIGQMEVFERSGLEIFLEFNKPVEQASLVWHGRDARPVTEAEMLEIEFDDLSGEEVMDVDLDAPLMPRFAALETRVAGELTPNGMAAVFHMTADVGGDFLFEVTDQHQLTNSAEPDRHMTVIYDLPPALTVSGLHNNDLFRPDDVLPVNCLVVDDIGVGELELHYRLNDDVEKVLPALEFDRGAVEVRHAFRMPLRDLALVTGDNLTVRVRARDERPEPGPQETWSQAITIRIDPNAAAAGQQALAEDTRQLVEALKQLEEILTEDAKKATELQERSQQSWNQDARDETQRLSEKEQQQGRTLGELATEVATHPMMQESAQTLQKLASTLREQLPQTLDEAVSQDRQTAANQLNEAARELDETRQQLHDEIQKIEEIARLEQDLAELNRLALDAEQLAKEAKQLESDRRNDENQPEDLNDRQWQQQLDQRQQALMQQQQQLSEELARMLQQKRQLLEAAQQSQRNQLTELSELARRLAEQQQQVAEGVNQEAGEAARDARELAKQLQQARNEAEQLNKDLASQDSPNPANLPKLDDAIEALKQGNLAEPQQKVADVADGLQQAEQEFRDAAADAAASESEAEASQKAADRSGELAKQLKDINEQITDLRQKRNVSEPRSQPNANPADANAGESPGEQPAASQEKLPQGTAADKAVRDLSNQLEELVATAQQISDGVQSDPNAEQPARQSAKEAAQHTRQGADQAAAGRFSDAAKKMRQAATAADQSSNQLSDTAQQDRREQSQGLRDDLNRVAETLQRLQQDDASQVAAQQSAQQNIADRASGLPAQLADLAERLNIEALEMAQQAQQTQLARQAAQAAQQSSQQASSTLQQGDLQSAGQSGQTTADELSRLAELAQEAGRNPGDSASLVPTEVGENIAEALQDLVQAAQAMQQSSEQQGTGESGDTAEQRSQSGQQQAAQQGQAGAAESGAQEQAGQPGEPGQQESGQPSQSGPSESDQNGQGQNGQGQSAGSEQLSSAAKALAHAALGTLPQQFNPGQMPDPGESSGAGRDAMGNAAKWDGLVPNAAGGPAGSRNWGKPLEELDTKTSDGVAVSRDSEYEALIRMYFREVAKATARGK